MYSTVDYGVIRDNEALRAQLKKYCKITCKHWIEWWLFFGFVEKKPSSRTETTEIKYKL